VRSQLDGSVAAKQDNSGVGSLWIVENAQLERLLFDRTLMGVEFRKICFDVTCRFLRHVADELADGRWSELVILSKGVVYEIALGAAQELDLNLPTNVVATSRVDVGATDAQIRALYARYDAGGDSIVIGDTVASGATIETALTHYQRVHKLSRVIVMSYAGTLVGARRLDKYCSQHGIELNVLYGLAAFGLGENGFDLSFLHPATVCADRYKERARMLFEGRAVSSPGWDFGTQCMAPEKYQALSWIEAQASGLVAGPIFSHAKEPTDWRLVAREADAYARMLPDLPVATPLDDID
jgi:hypothetical protein